MEFTEKEMNQGVNDEKTRENEKKKTKNNISGWLRMRSSLSETHMVEDEDMIPIDLEVWRP